jgi:Flp pilus assembly protein TadB
MDAVLVSTVFGLGLLFVFDGLARPGAGTEVLGSRIRSLGPRGLASAVGAAVGVIATGWPVASVAGGAVAWAVPGALRRSREERVRLERREAIAEVSSRLRDMIRSGLGISDALAQLVEHAPRAVAGELRRLEADARVSGLAEAGDAFAARGSDPSAALLGSALATADRLGSRNLSDVLDALAEATTAQAAAIREARVRQTRNRMSARIVAAAPVLLLVAIRQANPAYLEPFGQPAGQMVLGFAFALIWAGYVAMRRAARIERDVR